MGRLKKTKKFAAHKRMLNPHDARIKSDADRERERVKRETKEREAALNRAPATSSALFFKYNEQLGPPFQVLVDTNFLSFSVQNKIDVFKGMMDCLYAKCTPIITDCVMAELEKMGTKFRVALRIAKDPRFSRLPCQHAGTYADDCLFRRVSQHKCFIVATCDKDLRRRIRKVPGVPIMYVAQRRYSVERMPGEGMGAPKTG